MTPTVSIIIPTYNRETLLPRALDSVIAQSYQDWEIVLVDDGSSDGTCGVAAGYSARLGDRLVFLQQENRGSSSARNLGIDASRGRLVAFLDSDDEFLPDKLERQLAMFELCPYLGLVYSDFSYVDLDNVRHTSAFDTKVPFARRVRHTEVAPRMCVCSDLFDALIRQYFIATIVGMVRRDVLADEIRFPPSHAYAEEWLFYLKVAKACPAGFIDEPLCLHHHVEKSLARTDKYRNTRRYRDLIRAIDDSFDDLTYEQRRVVHDNIADSSRQAAYDAYRDARYNDALRGFAEAFRYRPAFRSLLGAAESLARCLKPTPQPAGP